MIKDCKICGVSNLDILNFIINYHYPPRFVGFICNYYKSPRYVELNDLKKLLDIEKNKSKFVAVLVNPEDKILEDIKNLPFDYYQLYDCSPDKTKRIKEKYQKKIITAITVEKKIDINKLKLFSDITDIYLFDSKGYEKSESFDHNLIKDIKLKEEIMVAGNIKFNDNLEKYKKIADFIDLSGGLETSGLKDKKKIEIFLNNLNRIKNET